ncbi:MAG TPA: hypothetical protein VFE61_29870 [Candidatus Sulfotelmatobacter sp.]|jgi:hypothetical protein|nr:hypothetical protein [Candidatus Sulfotelmatobacter sp.]
MDDSSIAGHIEKLRREIELILQEERKFRGLHVHTQAARMARASRELRIREIRAELENLQRPKAS